MNVVTKLEEITLAELAGLFVDEWDEPIKDKRGRKTGTRHRTDTTVRDQILNRLARRPGVTHVVLFENTLMDSSEFGRRTAVICGPDCTYKTPEDALQTVLHAETVSRRQYPTRFARVPTE